MCLLEHVKSCSDEAICCETFTHLEADNPLRHQQRLAAVHLCEYAAQAAALHGPWLARQQSASVSDLAPAAGGYLAALKSIGLRVARLDNLSPSLPLVLTATKLLSNADGLIYEFEARHGDVLLASGRLVIALLGRE